MIHEKFIANGAGVLITEVTESLSNLEAGLTNFEIYKSAYENLKTDKRKLEFLGLRIAINELLNDAVEIIYDKDGKPALKNSPYHISLSHSGKWLAVMAHPTRKVGIDIECPTDKFEKLYKRFLSQTEQEELYCDKDLRKLQIAWSVKEALYKIIGNEAVDFANQLRIFAFDIESSNTVKAEHIPTGTIYHLQYKIDNQFILAYSIA